MLALGSPFYRDHSGLEHCNMILHRRSPPNISPYSFWGVPISWIFDLLQGSSNFPIFFVLLFYFVGDFHNFLSPPCLFFLLSCLSYLGIFFFLRLFLLMTKALKEMYKLYISGVNLLAGGLTLGNKWAKNQSFHEHKPKFFLSSVSYSLPFSFWSTSFLTAASSNLFPSGK